MAKPSPINSDIESESDGAQSRKKTNNAKPRESPDSVDMDQQDGEEEQEEEYEIEVILDAKRGSFPEGRIGYFVKWKGYTDADNSWVDELDAGNAQDLIEEFWKKHPKKAKKQDVKTPKRPRASKSGDDEAVQPKKRGRKSQAAETDDEDRAGDTGSRLTSKKPRKAQKDNNNAVAGSEDEVELTFYDLDEFKDVGDWEPLISKIDTIERESDGNLMIYFTLKSGERAREVSTVCHTRFPQMLLAFYEGNLRWKTAEESMTDSS